MICSSENLDRFIACLLSGSRLTLKRGHFRGAGQGDQTNPSASRRAFRLSSIAFLFFLWLFTQSPKRYPSLVLCRIGITQCPFSLTNALRRANPSSHCSSLTSQTNPSLS